MTRVLLYLVFSLNIISGGQGYAQVVTSQIKAGFGIDGDLRRNFFNGAVLSGNDDWYSNLSGTGISVIDTSGAAQIVSNYIANSNSRLTPLFRSMAYPQYSVINNRMLIDAVFIRDHHGTDSSSFASGPKNADNPLNWQTGTTPVNNKGDILDMFMHVRRDGVKSTDSLWFFGAVSIDGVTGNRCFDFEMYQTDIVYDVASQKFTGYGPDEGHTSWEFDAAGNVTKPGDIIFAANYQNSSLSSLEARIWVRRSTRLSMTPAAFSWGRIMMEQIMDPPLFMPV